jgi:hypothetical protein
MPDRPTYMVSGGKKWTNDQTACIRPDYNRLSIS